MHKTLENTSHGFFLVLNDRGLHCRPSTEIVKCATLFKSEIFLSYKKMRVNAKSLFGILTLAAPRGAKIKIEAHGEDSKEAVLSLTHLADHSFHIHY